MTDLQVGFGWNSFQTCSTSSCASASIKEAGIQNWKDMNLIISIYFYVASLGVYNLSVSSALNQREAELEVSCPQYNYNYIAQFNTDSLLLSLGSLNVTSAGYVRIDFKGSNSLVNKKTGNYPSLVNLTLSGVQNTSSISYVTKDFSSHFGRRGPSVHLRYSLEKTTNITTFFNEVTVPSDWDTIGTYAMAIGFNQGYFGMQVNSKTQRRILFSVWSPQSTNDPKSLLPENQVLLVEKGANTTAKEFGGEGSGGQSYLVYPWVAGVAYQFKLTGQPSTDGYSIFSAYFKDPTKMDDYILIASWRRPKTQTYLGGLHSFLENFSPETGHISRMAFYNNQSALDNQGNSVKVPSASFSIDSTGSQKKRLDYDGGVQQGQGYYLKNCGFFNKTSVKYGDRFYKQ